MSMSMPPTLYPSGQTDPGAVPAMMPFMMQPPPPHPQQQPHQMPPMPVPISMSMPMVPSPSPQSHPHHSTSSYTSAAPGSYSSQAHQIFWTIPQPPLQQQQHQQTQNHHPQYMINSQAHQQQPQTNQNLNKSQYQSPHQYGLVPGYGFYRVLPVAPVARPAHSMLCIPSASAAKNPLYQPMLVKHETAMMIPSSPRSRSDSFSSTSPPASPPQPNLSVGAAAKKLVMKVIRKPRLQQPKRKRSASIDELRFCGYMYSEEDNAGPLSRIRVWVNDRNHKFYDCECGNRRAVQDLRKIARHVRGHDVQDHPCPHCNRVFNHHLQLNAHQKIHKRDRSDSAGSVIPLPADKMKETATARSDRDELRSRSQTQ